MSASADDDEDNEEDRLHSESDHTDDSTMVSISKYESDSSTEFYEDQKSTEEPEDTKNMDDKMNMEDKKNMDDKMNMDDKIDTDHKKDRGDKRDMDDKNEEVPDNPKRQKKTNMKLHTVESVVKRPTQDTAVVHGARLYSSDGNSLLLYCSICVHKFATEIGFREHIKSRSHLFMAQGTCRCFKCFQIFPDMNVMYEHVKSCDTSDAFDKLVNTDYVNEEKT